MDYSDLLNEVAKAEPLAEDEKRLAYKIAAALQARGEWAAVAREIKSESNPLVIMIWRQFIAKYRHLVEGNHDG